MNGKPKRNQLIETSMLPDGHAVLVSKKTDWAYTLTPTAAIIWEFCDGSNSIDDIVANLQQIPELATSPSLKSEVIVLLTELQDDGYLENE